MKKRPSYIYFDTETKTPKMLYIVNFKIYFVNHSDININKCYTLYNDYIKSCLDFIKIDVYPMLDINEIRASRYIYFNTRAICSTQKDIERLNSFLLKHKTENTLFEYGHDNIKEMIPSMEYGVTDYMVLDKDHLINYSYIGYGYFQCDKNSFIELCEKNKIAVYNTKSYADMYEFWGEEPDENGMVHIGDNYFRFVAKDKKTLMLLKLKNPVEESFNLYIYQYDGILPLEQTNGPTTNILERINYG